MKPIVRANRVVTIIHDLQYIHFPEHWPLLRRLRMRACHETTLRKCDAVVSISQAVKDDILKFYGDGPTSTAAAAESGGHLTDLLSGSSGAAADASNFWTELLSAFDGGSAAADASNLWTELASLF